ncbi:hypothetical protein AVEN_139363-1 [Araneus ventricosus]|uniref:Uncharacterized protein n=1 Tax=Araneus ventricosus TaxID=182803 RepID=A0A4Y2EEB2_ARAVE|nr:hypothetical protein AVEN_139363-1 [Araneus ventricosus]
MTSKLPRIFLPSRNFPSIHMQKPLMNKLNFSKPAKIYRFPRVNFPQSRTFPKPDRTPFLTLPSRLEKGSPILKVNNPDTVLRHRSRGMPGNLASGQSRIDTAGAKCQG